MTAISAPTQLPAQRTPAEFLAAALDARTARGSLTSTQQRRAALYLVLGLVELDEAEEELIGWLAELDQVRVETLASLFAKLALA